VGIHFWLSAWHVSRGIDTFHIISSSLGMARALSSSRILIPLFVLTAISTAGLSLLAIRHGEPSTLTHLLWAWGFALILVSWVRVDARARGYLRPFDFDAFVFFGWPIMVPYYLCRIRRSRGLLSGLGICSLYPVPDVIAQIISVAIRVASSR